jgi:XTP/dITP diphosphohydrolase
MSKDRKTVFVTSNRHKAEEVLPIFNSYSIPVDVVYAKTLEIQSESLDEIAVFSAVQAYQFVKKPVFVEDAGLFITGLKGFPGPYSSYVYTTLGLEGVLRLVEGTDRAAVFLSNICYFDPATGPRLFKGVCKGRIAPQPRGSGGFGFDPIFIPEKDTRTFAEMSLEEKNRLSHRGSAVRRLCRWLYKVRNGPFVR